MKKTEQNLDHMLKVNEKAFSEDCLGVFNVFVYKEKIGFSHRWPKENDCFINNEGIEKLIHAFSGYVKHNILDVPLCQDLADAEIEREFE